jgi:hypothetical protein
MPNGASRARFGALAEMIFPKHQTASAQRPTANASRQGRKNLHFTREQPSAFITAQRFNAGLSCDSRNQVPPGTKEL